MTALDAAKLAALAHLWREVEAAPLDDQKHQKLVRFAVDNALYLPAIERYKALAQHHPEHAELAQRWQKAIAAQAAAKVLARAPREATPKNRGMRTFMALVFSGVLVFALGRC